MTFSLWSLKRQLNLGRDVRKQTIPSLRVLSPNHKKAPYFLHILKSSRAHPPHRGEPSAVILATDAGNRLLVTFSLVSSQRLRMILRSVHGFELDDIQPLEFKKAVESGTGCEKADNIYIYIRSI